MIEETKQIINNNWMEHFLAYKNSKVSPIHKNKWYLVNGGYFFFCESDGENDYWQNFDTPPGKYVTTKIGKIKKSNYVSFEDLQFIYDNEDFKLTREQELYLLENTDINIMNLFKSSLDPKYQKFRMQHPEGYSSGNLYESYLRR